MTQEEQRITIAEACGFRRPPQDDVEANKKGWWYRPPGDNSCALVMSIPDYLNDLNTMHGAEEWLKLKNLFNIYLRHLWIVCEGSTEAFHHFDYADLGGVVHASAAQRAEAFLRTIGKWVDH